jgi:anti-sigma B factor antagonist
MGPHDRGERGIIVIRVLERQLDSVSAHEVKRRLARLIGNQHHRLVLDISEVEFIDARGLSALVFALKRMGYNGALALVGPRDTVVSMLKLTRLYGLFNIFPDCERAIIALRPSSENMDGVANNPQA